MPTYQYKAVDAGGVSQGGIVDAVNEQEAVKQLRDRGLLPIRVEAGFGPAEKKAGNRLFQSRRVTRDQLLALTRDLANLVKSGLSLDRALEILIGLADTPAVASLLQGVRDEVRGGATLSQALERRPHVFSKLYANMVRAGEASGNLGGVLERLTEFQERSRELRQTVVSAMVYPSIVLGIAGVAIAILVMYVIPQFDSMFKDNSKAMPAATQFVLGTSKWLRANWWILPLFVFGTWWIASWWLNSPRGQARWHARKLSMPVFGELTQKIEVARLSRTLATLLNSGVSLLPALGIVKETVTNVVLAASLDGVTAKLREGRGLGTPLMETGLYPKLAVHMVKVGEETGQLPTMLAKVADIYERDVQVSVKRTMTFLEPMLLLFLAIIIGGIIGSVLLGMMSISDTLS
jgi:general secretion pathway protein F